ncbi:DJ-1/PfpI family protein [Falsiroseomonas stagni]|uniref:DJ-1/PfpI family protein n=1 Tax=Falsiroseomonas stagni DSM 19981 TaxID=1123062 RepID=A0A1I4B355_9PROT|nr:DJ-1/PfpI family protein [Falsiroseomonas stagni]SFK62316.1 DJ-1/PfpI family protein [Falsiroseomonas stagni DSM 19981]
MSERFRVLFVIYPGMTQLDFTGPHQFLSRLPGGEVLVASPAGGAVPADGLVFGDTLAIAAVDRCDLICIPGGPGATVVAQDQDFIAEVRRLAAGARYVTSVCTGAFVLGAAGLLKGKRATTHWAWHDLLPLFGAIPVAERVVRDGNVITGGGVTAGIDFALTVLAEIAGEEAAQAVQLGLEYAPAPPFEAGSAATAPPGVLTRVQAVNARMAPKRRAEAEEAAARLG